MSCYMREGKRVGWGGLVVEGRVKGGCGLAR